MKYGSDYLIEAQKMISTRKKNRETLYSRKLQEIYKAIPELEKIDASLSSLGSAAAIAAISGKTEAMAGFSDKCQKLQERKNEILESANVEGINPCCSLCNDTGYTDGRTCNCVKQLAIKLNLDDLSKEFPVSSTGFSDFDLKYYPDTADKNGVIPRKIMTSVFKMSKEYCLSFSKDSESILFMGGVGLGKTHLSLAIVKEIISKGYSVIYGSAQNIFNDIEKEHFSYSGSTERMDALLNCNLLVIDDLGTEFSTSFTQSAFYNIVNTRILKHAPTIISTNLSFKELEERYTPRISSRFIGNYEMIKFFGNDIRMQKKLQKK